MEQHIELDDTYMNVIKFGSGKKILTVIAGISLCGLEGLGNQIENNFRFLTSDFTVYIFDRKKVLPENYTMTDMAEDIFLWSKNRMTGSRATEPRKERIQLKENGPIASPPSDCATKAMPQINAVKNSNILLFKWLFIIIFLELYYNSMTSFLCNK